MRICPSYAAKARQRKVTVRPRIQGEAGAKVAPPAIPFLAAQAALAQQRIHFDSFTIIFYRSFPRNSMDGLVIFVNIYTSYSLSPEGSRFHRGPEQAAARQGAVPEISQGKKMARRELAIWIRMRMEKRLECDTIKLIPALRRRLLYGKRMILL